MSAVAHRSPRSGNLSPGSASDAAPGSADIRCNSVQSTSSSPSLHISRACTHAVPPCPRPQTSSADPPTAPPAASRLSPGSKRCARPTLPLPHDAAGNPLFETPLVPCAAPPAASRPARTSTRDTDIESSPETFPHPPRRSAFLDACKRYKTRALSPRNPALRSRFPRPLRPENNLQASPSAPSDLRTPTSQRRISPSLREKLRGLCNIGLPASSTASLPPFTAPGSVCLPPSPQPAPFACFKTNHCNLVSALS